MYSKIPFNFKPMLWKSKHGLTYFHHMVRSGRIASTLFHVVSTCLLNNRRDICCLRCITINNWSGCEIPKREATIQNWNGCLYVDWHWNWYEEIKCMYMGGGYSRVDIIFSLHGNPLAITIWFLWYLPQGEVISNYFQLMCKKRRCNLMEKLFL